MNGLWSRLRKARLAQVLLVYFGASWVVLEVTDVFIDKFGLPNWFFQAAILLLLIGLVVLATTAWVQAQPVATRETEQPSPWEVDLVDLRESVSHGRLPHLTWARALLGGAVAFTLLFAVAAGYVLIREETLGVPGPGEAEAAQAPGIAVLPFRVVGPDSELWREGMIDLLSTNLEGTAGLRKIDPRAVMSHWRSEVGEDAAADNEQAALRVAAGLDASYALIGSMVGSESGVRLIVEVYSVDDGVRLGAAQVEGTADSLLGLVDRLSVEIVRTGLVPAASEIPDIDLSRVTTSSLPALRAYLEGERLYRRSRYEESIPHFTRAAELDSTFALAHYRLALAHGETGSAEAGDYANRAARLSAELPERAMLLLRGNQQFSQGRLSALATLSELTSRYPDDVEGWYLLGAAYYMIGPQGLHPRHRFREALRRAIELSPYYGPAYPFILRDAFLRGDSAEVGSLLEAYKRIDSSNDYCRGFEVAYSLLWGENAGLPDIEPVLDTVPAGALSCTAGATLDHPEFSEAIVTTLRRRAEAAPDPSERADALWALAVIRIWRGQIRDAWRTMAEYPPRPDEAYVHRLHLTSQLAAFKDTVAYRARVRRLVREGDPLEHLLLGILAVDHGRWAEVERLVGALEEHARTARGDGDSLAVSDARAFAGALRGYAASRGGDEALALQELESSLPDLPGLGPGFIRSGIHEFLRMEAGNLWLARGEPERALEYFDSYRFWSSAFSAQSDYYLGQAYAALGQTEAAVKHYGLFVRWREESDPELRSQVERAQRALANLTGEPLP